MELITSLLKMRTFLLIIFAIYSGRLTATTWEAAYPYTQQITGQDVTIEATPYYAYVGSPLPGITKVFFKKKLLYTIDKYYREKIFTSQDGQYVAIVRTTNTKDVSSYITMGFEQIDYSQPAIEIYKEGTLYKSFSLKEIIDTLKLLHSGFLYNWGYTFNRKIYEEAESGCEACVDVYGKKVLRLCTPSKITASECEECRRTCDSVKLEEAEICLAENSSYVVNNCLYIISNQNVIIKFDFSTLTISKLLFQDVIINKLTFDPPKLIRKIKKVTLPEKFDLPDLKNGQTIESAVMELFGMPKNSLEKDKTIEISIYSLTINRSGICTDAKIEVYIKNADNEKNPLLDPERTAKLLNWARQQKFKTNMLPKGFAKYSFYSFLNV